MPDQWKFLKATTVYLYPSANADDGGDVNSEHNVAGITDKLIQKNFIVRKNEDTSPLKVSFIVDNGHNYLSVTTGEAIINGYLVGLNPPGNTYIIYRKEIHSSEIPGYSDYYNKFKVIWKKWYDDKGNRINVSKNDTREPIPRLYVVVKLLKDTTGNLRGDLLNLENTGELINYCRGSAWGIVTEDELKKLDAPHVVLGSFMPDINLSNNESLVVRKENPDEDYTYNSSDRYSYLYIDSVYQEGDLTLNQYIVNLIKEATDTQHTLTYYTYPEDPDGKTGPRQKFLEVTVKNGTVEVIRYEADLKDGELQYDRFGNIIVKKIQDNLENRNYDKTYSVDDIQRRTHPASSSNSDRFNSFESQVAHDVDSLDTGEGKYSQIGTVPQDKGGKSTETFNGQSELLARADHSHDVRYVRTSEGEVEDTNYKDLLEQDTQYQDIRRLNILQKLASRRLKVGHLGTSNFSDFNVWEDGMITSRFINTYEESGIVVGTGLSGRPVVYIGSRKTSVDAESSRKNELSKDLDSYDSQEQVDLVVTGTVQASRVFNAVWNDYAELYKKDDPEVEVEPGTVICKVKGKDTYAPSTYENRKLVVGVVSDSYGHLLGGSPKKSVEENLKEYVPVAVSGRVYVKLAPRCTVEEGDLLSVSGFEGRVVACQNPTPGTVVGKALESSGYENPKDKILMQVMLA